MNRTFKALPLSILLLVPVLVTAQAAPATNQEQRSPSASTAPAASSFGLRNAANTTSNSQSTKAAAAQNDARKQRYTEALGNQRYVAIDSQTTVLVSEICTYSQYTYTYTCK